MVQHTEIQREQEYDALNGRYMRKIKVNDVFHIATSASTDTGSGTNTVLASGTTDANSNVFLTGIGISASSAATFWVTAGSSTIMAIRLSAAGETSKLTTKDAPFFRVPASTTVNVVADSAGTYAAFLYGVREPIISKVE